MGQPSTFKPTPHTMKIFLVIEKKEVPFVDAMLRNVKSGLAVKLFAPQSRFLGSFNLVQFVKIERLPDLNRHMRYRRQHIRCNTTLEQLYFQFLARFLLNCDCS